MTDNKTIAQIKVEMQKKYYPDKLPTINNFQIGNRVKIITPCEDFLCFYEETGVITKIKDEYMGITVKLDKIKKNGGISEGEIRVFNFKPESLFKIGIDTVMTDNKEMPERVFIDFGRRDGSDNRIITGMISDVRMVESDVEYIRADKVEKDLQKVRDTLCLLNSMIDCGERHSVRSLSAFTDVLDIINHALIKKEIPDDQ